jgi:hypothetical protein
MEITNTINFYNICLKDADFIVKYLKSFQKYYDHIHYKALGRGSTT